MGISGASGAIIGYRLLEVLRELGVETHLVVSRAAEQTLRDETDHSHEELCALADCVHDVRNMGALISSGSFETAGMVIAPCSMKTLSAIANSYDENLLIRAADVCLKENRRVVLVPREMPLNKAHLRNLQLCAEEGCCIIPPMMTFYNRPKTIEDMIDHLVGKILMQFGITAPKFRPWEGSIMI